MRWLTAGVATLLTLGVGELVLRTVRPSSRQLFVLQGMIESERGKFCAYDPEIGWIGKPDLSDTFTYLEVRHQVRQNRYGFRGSEHPLERTGRRRIVVLGDSFVWGFGVEEEQLFTRIMEVEAARPVEVVNMGVSGYGNGQELLLWRRLGVRFAPDDVLLFVYPQNDLVDNVSTVRYGCSKPRLMRGGDGGILVTNTPVPKRHVEERVRTVAVGAPLLRSVAARSALLSSALLAAARIDGVRQALEACEILGMRRAGFGGEKMLFMEPVDPQTYALFQVLWGLLFAIRDEVARAGASLRVVVVPQPFQVYPGVWQDFTQRNRIAPGRRWSREAPQRHIEEICASLGIPVIDVLAPLRERGARDPYLYYPRNQHWTAQGHAAVAQVLLRELSLAARPDGAPAAE